MLENFLQSEIYGYISIALRFISALILVWAVKKVPLWKKPIFGGISICIFCLSLIPSIEWMHPIYPFIIGATVAIIGYLGIGIAFSIYHKTHSD